jgi:hypothetical protein
VPFIRQIGTHARLITLLYGLVALVLLGPIASADHFPKAVDFHDHIGAIVQAKMALLEGQFPLRVAPWELHGWRYAFFQFYGTTPYTLAGAIYAWITPASPYTAFKLTIWLATTFGAIYAYRLIFWLFHSRHTAVLTGMAYITAPYFISNIVTRGDFTEALAEALLPFVIYATLRCYDAPKHLGYFLGAAFAWFLLITTHMLTFAYTSLFLGLLLIALSAAKKPSWRNLLFVGFAYLYGCCLALWFLVPALLMPLRIAVLHIKPITMNWLTPLSSLLSFNALTPQAFVNDVLVLPLHPAVGLPMTLAAGIVVFAACTQRLPSLQRRLVLSALVLFLLALFMAWSPFDFWTYLPPMMSIVQWCYRLLGQVAWLGMFLFASALLWLFKGQVDERHVAIGLFLLAIACSPWLRSQETSPLSVAEQTATPSIAARNDYLVHLPRIPVIVNSMPLYGLVTPDHQLQTERIAAVSNRLFWHTKLSLEIKGKLKPEAQALKMNVYINDQLAKQRVIQPGNFTWDIPLAPFVGTAVQKPVRLQIKTDHDSTKLRMTVVALTGLKPNLHLMPLSEVQPHCERRGTKTFCTINVAEPINLLELPILHYPNLLKITRNGQVIPYSPLLHQTVALTAIQPTMGSNHIEIEFRGLAWANWLSVLAWLSWLGLLMYTVVRKRKPYALAV